MSDTQRQQMRMIMDAVVDSVRAAGPMGAPGGVLYAALMVHGCTLENFQALMGVLVKVGKLTQKGNLYFVPGV